MEQKQKPKKAFFYCKKEREQKNTEEILKYRREKFEKYKSTRCDMLKNLLDERGMRYHDLDMMEIPHTNVTCLKIYCSSCPMVFIHHSLKNGHFFRIFDDTLDVMEMPLKTSTCLIDDVCV